MAEYRYLIVGGSMTAHAACRGIREHDADGSIGLFGEELHEPYARPPLTKALWKGKEEDSIWRGTPDLGVDLHTGRAIASLDLDGRSVTDSEGETHSYERLLLATGGTPRRVDSWHEDVIYYRTLDHYRQLRSLAGDGVRATVVGGGFIGSELAAALNMNGCAVTLVFPDAGISAKVFPEDLSEFVNGYYREKGVDVLSGEKVAGIGREDGTFRVELESGRTIEADVVVAGLGIVPRTDLAEQSGLRVDDGVIVDEYGRVEGHDDVYAAGDVARFPALALGGLRRVEHENHANSHGRYVGANMAGADTPYDHLPFFYSDLFDLGYEAVGDVESRLETVAEWAEPNRKGVVCYVEGGKPRGFLLWDVWDKVEPPPSSSAPASRSTPPISARSWSSRSGRRPARKPEPHHQPDRDHVEHDVAARDAAGRVRLRELETGNRRSPRPRAERGAVELEGGDDEVDPGVHRPPRPQQHEDEERAPDRAGDVGRGQHRQPGEAPDRRCGRSDRDHDPRPAQRRERDAGEVDEPVPRRHVRGDVVEPVLVEAPDQRADDLADRRHAHDRERLPANGARLEREQRREHGGGEQAEDALARRVDRALQQEPARGPRDDDRERDEGKAAHSPYLRR